MSMTYEEHMTKGEEWLEAAYEYDATADRAAAMATAHFAAAAAIGKREPVGNTGPR